MRTLLHLLWSDLVAFPQGDGPVEPSRAPALGLPFRTAAFLLFKSLQNVAAMTLGGESLPPWILAEDVWTAYVSGRRLQLDMAPVDGFLVEKRLDPAGEVFSAENVVGWPIPKHAAYDLPIDLPGVPPAQFLSVWHCALQFVTAIDGTEAILDQILAYAPTSMPLEERWHLRMRLPMPTVVWSWLEEITRVARTGDFNFNGLEETTDSVCGALGELFTAAPLSLPNDFLAERVDVLLSTAASADFPCAVERRVIRPLPAAPRVEVSLPLPESLTVRMAQLTAEPDDHWQGFAERFPRLRRNERRRVLLQVAQVFEAAPQTEQPWELAVFPEVCLPPRATKQFERLVAETGRGGIIGCLWRKLPFAQAPVGTAVGMQYLVNEALVSTPLASSQRTTRPRVRSFLVRKPLPAHVEVALAQRLTNLAAASGQSTQYRMLAGKRIYRFVHERWGDFTVAICSDLLDPAPWASLKGQVLHLFMPAYNKDISLFDSLTWVRAYENYVNLVAINCGHYGGSFAWSPKARDEKEIARIRGADLMVVADVALPVASLYAWQRDGVDASIHAAVEQWAAEPQEPAPPRFKAPPPGYLSRLP